MDGCRVFSYAHQGHGWGGDSSLGKQTDGGDAFLNITKLSMMLYFVMIQPSGHNLCNRLYVYVVPLSHQGTFEM